jgi:hypothetical protein
MAKAKLGFSELSVPQKIVKARLFVTQLTGNENFPNPDPTLQQISDAATALEKAYNEAQDGGKTKIATAKAAEEALDKIIDLFVDYVQFASKGDETIIRSSGLDVRSAKSAPQDLPMVTNLATETTLNDGEIHLSWDRISNSKVYKIETSADGSTNWQHIGESTKAAITLTHLASGSKPWFRVAAVGAKGQGTWSDPVKGLVR